MKIGPHLVAVLLAVFVSAPVSALDTGGLPDAPSWMSASERLGAALPQEGVGPSCAAIAGAGLTSSSCENARLAAAAAVSAAIAAVTRAGGSLMTKSLGLLTDLHAAILANKVGATVLLMLSAVAAIVTIGFSITAAVHAYLEACGEGGGSEGPGDDPGDVTHHEPLPELLLSPA